jgi:hypothetical protein
VVRWLLATVCGPRCDSGSGIGLGCLRRAKWMASSLTRPIGWSRSFLWCDEHKHAGDVPLVAAQKGR